jgi:hypothetical protein
MVALDHRLIRSRSASRALTLCALTLASTSVLAGTAQAASPVPLATADSFAVLAGSTITNTGPTTIAGDIGLCCTGTQTPGFGSLIQPRGALYVGTGGVAATAQNDLDLAYANAAGQPVGRTLPVDLSLSGTPATPLLPGVYASTAHGALQINTGLTLDFQGDPNAVFVFQGTTLTTATGAPGSVRIVNGGSAPSACNIYWQLSSSATGVTLGSGSAFKGTTMALGASVLGTGATVEGRILTRRSKAVTLDANTIAQGPCAAPTAAGGGTGAQTPSPTPTTVPAITPTPISTSPISTSAISTTPATAHIAGPSGPVAGPFTVAVTGKGIAKVIFRIDGRRVRTVHAKPGRSKFTLKIDPRRQSHRLHRIVARVTFKTPGRTGTTLRLIYRRPPARARPPQFAG